MPLDLQHSRERFSGRGWDAAFRYGLYDGFRRSCDIPATLDHPQLEPERVVAPCWKDPLQTQPLRIVIPLQCAGDAFTDHRLTILFQQLLSFECPFIPAAFRPSFS